MRTRKPLEDEMLVTHPVRDTSADSGTEQPGRPSSAMPDRAELRRRLLSAADPAERAEIIRGVQQQFGNDTAESLIREARLSRDPQESEKKDE